MNDKLTPMQHVMAELLEALEGLIEIQHEGIPNSLFLALDILRGELLGEDFASQPVLRAEEDDDDFATEAKRETEL